MKRYEHAIPDTDLCWNRRDLRSPAFDTERIPPEEVAYRVLVEQAHDPTARKATDPIDMFTAAAQEQVQEHNRRCPNCGAKLGKRRTCPGCGEKRWKQVTMIRDSDRCPVTGNLDCTRCSGEFCERHGTQPCDCDVIERHETT